MSLQISATERHTSRVNFGSTSIGQSTEVTVACWCRCTDLSNFCVLAGPRDNSGWEAELRWHFFVNGSGNFGYNRTYTGDNMAALTSASSVISDGSTWQFVAFVDYGTSAGPKSYLGDETTVVVDDTTSPTTPTSALRTGSKPFSLYNSGRSDLTEGFAGDIAFFAVFDTALEIADMKAMQFNPVGFSLANHANLEALYVPGVGGTSNVYDWSGNGLNSTSITGTLTYEDNPPANFQFAPFGSFSPGATLAAADVTISAGTVAKTITARNATIAFDHKIAAGVDAKTITPRNATINLGVGISAGVATKTITPRNATINLGVGIAAGTAAKTITARNATIAFDHKIAAGVDAKTITPRNATVSLGVNINAGVVAKTITPLAATLNLPANISAGVGALSLATHAATISLAVPTTFAGGAGAHAPDAFPYREADDEGVLAIIDKFLEVRHGQP